MLHSDAQKLQKSSLHFKPDVVVQEQCFLWERGTTFGVDFGLFHFADLLHA